MYFLNHAVLQKRTIECVLIISGVRRSVFCDVVWFGEVANARSAKIVQK